MPGSSAGTPAHRLQETEGILQVRVDAVMLLATMSRGINPETLTLVMGLHMSPCGHKNLHSGEIWPLLASASSPVKWAWSTAVRDIVSMGPAESLTGWSPDVGESLKPGVLPQGLPLMQMWTLALAPPPRWGPSLLRSASRTLSSTALPRSVVRSSSSRTGECPLASLALVVPAGGLTDDRSWVLLVCVSQLPLAGGQHSTISFTAPWSMGLPGTLASSYSSGSGMLACRPFSWGELAATRDKLQGTKSQPQPHSNHV